MTVWIEMLVAALWRAGWAVLPVAFVVAIVCRFGRCTASTRHALWLTTLVCMVAAMWLPGPTVTPPPPPEPVYFIGGQSYDAPAWPSGQFVPLVGGRKAPKRDYSLEKSATPAQVAADAVPTPPRTSACITVASPAWLATATDRIRRLSNFLSDSANAVTDRVHEEVPVSQEYALKAGAKCAEPDFTLNNSFAADCISVAEAHDCRTNCEKSESSALIAFASTTGNWLASIPELTVEMFGVARREVADTVATARANAPVETSASTSAVAHPRVDIAAVLAAAGAVRTTTDPDELDPWPNDSGAEYAELLEWRRYASSILGVRDAIGRVPPLPASAWFAGFLACMGILLFRSSRATSRLQSARPADADTCRLVAREARRLGLSVAPATLMIADRVSPLIWCGRPVRLILPESLWKELDDDGRRAVVCHELAHIRRRDHWVRWFEIVVGCLFWWHPVMWWVRGRLSEEADACCDEWVTWVLPRERRAYAEALIAATDFVSGTVGPKPFSMAMASARASKIARRLTMIMTATRRPGLGLNGICSVLVLGALAWVATPVQSCPPEEETVPRVSPVPAPAPIAVQTISAPDGETVVRRRRPMQQGNAVGQAGVVSWEEPGVASDPEMADRLRQIEESQKRLSEDLRRLSNALNRMSGGTPAPSAAVPPVPAIAGAVAPAMSGASGNLAPAIAVIPGTRAQFDQPIVQRVYKLSGDRLEAMVELMIRDDVPVCVMPVDGGIQVTATEAQHGVFAAFVKMITNDDEAPEVKLPEGKLDAVKKLAALESVPTRFVLTDDTISVQGSAAEQAVFDAFIALIHPRTPSGSLRTTTPVARPAVPGRPAQPAQPARPGGATGRRSPFGSASAAAERAIAEEALARGDQQRARDVLIEADRKVQLEREVAAEKARTAGASHAQMEVIQAKLAKLSEEQKALEKLADQHESEADALHAESHELDDSDKSAALRAKAREIRTMARQVRRDAGRIDAQIVRLEKALLDLEIGRSAGR